MLVLIGNNTQSQSGHFSISAMHAWWHPPLGDVPEALSRMLLLSRCKAVCVTDHCSTHTTPHKDSAHAHLHA